MKRYIRVYLQFIKINIALLLTYRASFFMTIVYTVFWGVIGIFNMYILTLRLTNAYGWSRNELIVLASLYPIFAGTFYLFCASNIGRIPDIIHRADLDLILTKPIDSQFLLSFRFIDYLQVVRILVCLGFLVFFINAIHLPISIPAIVLSMLLGFAGLCIVYSVWFGLITISMWFTNLSNLRDLLYTSMGTLRYPTNMYIKSGSIFLSVFILFSFALSIPVKIFLQKAALWEVGMLLAISIVAVYLSRKFWQFALTFYTSASG